MSVLLKAVEVFLLVIFSVFILLIFLFHFSVRLEASIEGKRVKIIARYLFLKFSLTGDKKKKSKKEDAEERVPAETEEAADKESPGIKELWEKYSVYLDTAKKEVKYLGKHIKIDGLYLTLYVFSEYASIAGMKTGAAWAFIGNVRAALDSVFGKNVSYADTNVITCYIKENAGEDAAGCTVKMRPVCLIPAAIMFLKDYNRIKKMRPADAGKNT